MEYLFKLFNAVGLMISHEGLGSVFSVTVMRLYACSRVLHLSATVCGTNREQQSLLLVQM